MAGVLASAHMMCAQTTPPPNQPVYIFVTANVGDYVNKAISEERLRRTLPLIEKYRKDNPSLAATLYFSGAMSDALAQNNAQDHLLDFVKGFIQRGAVRPGYDGSDEPTYEHRPMLDYSKTKTPEDRWLARVEVAKALLNEARDPMTGAPQPGKSGGLKRMQEVFGPAAMIRGVVLIRPNMYGPLDEVGGDSEIVNVLRQMNKDAILVGLTESDLAHTSGSQFRPWADQFSKEMSPFLNTAPEVFWQEDAPRLSETSLLDWRPFHAEDGVDKLKAALKGLNRTHVRIIQVQLGGQRIYAMPPKPPLARIILPLSWAYQHPDSPLYPADMTYSKAEVEAHYAAQEAAVKYLVSEFLPANPGSRFVSVDDVKALAKQPGYGYEVSVEKLRATVGEVLKVWGDKTTPPLFVPKIDDRFLSLADWFAVMADALAQRSRTGNFPATVHLGRVFGPVSTAQHRPLPTGEVTADSVARTCVKLVDALHDDSWNAAPHNAIPNPITIDGLSLTPAQFLRLMAEALVAPTPTAKLQVKPMEMFASKLVTFYNRRALTDLGAAWTYKPEIAEPLAK